MPKFAFIGLGLLTCALAPLHADLLVQPNDRVLVACEAPLNQGMVSVDIAAYFLMCQPVDGLEVIGRPGDGLEPFMHSIPVTIAPWNPTVALISHGTDDGRAGKEDRDYTYYHPTYLGQTIDALKKIGVRTILLGSATPVDPAHFDNAAAFNTNLAAYRDLDRDLAAKDNLPFVDIFGAMTDAMTKAKAGLGADYAFNDAGSGHTPSRPGQLVMAWAFLKALGADGNIGTITVDLDANTATGTPGQKIVSMQNGTVNVESTRYPFCFTTSPPYPPEEDVAKLVPYTSFNQDLNRYMLVVKGLKTDQAKITWGNSPAMPFTKTDLEKGINLAALFAGKTPFDPTFSHIVDQLWQQQLKQFVWNDGTISHLDDIAKMAPGAPVDQLIGAIRAQDAKNGAAVKTMMVPIDHTIKIEPVP